MIDEEGNATKLLVADLIRYAIQGEDNVSYACSGPECIPYSISALNKLNEVDENLQRDLFVVFHNLKGFDGNYITEELYKQGMKVENQLRTGAKTLKFDYFYQDAKISFKDSLCIMPTALSELPGMFNFEELHKGWFPHAFYARENLSYKSRLPAKYYFQPQAMMPKKRNEFNTWYAAQVEKNEVYDLWKKLNKYWHSDVMVLKSACEAFITKFQDEAGFNPLENCATIASACNIFWRRELLP